MQVFFRQNYRPPLLRTFSHLLQLIPRSTLFHSCGAAGLRHKSPSGSCQKHVPQIWRSFRRLLLSSIVVFLLHFHQDFPAVLEVQPMTYPATQGRNIGYPLKYRIKLRWDYGVSEALKSVHPRGNPMSHSTHVGFSWPPFPAAILRRSSSVI